MHCFRYCPLCTGELAYNSAVHEGHATCIKCGFVVYTNPAPTVSAVILNNQGDLLLTKRAREPFKGAWDLPGGFLQAGESLEEGLHRELKEELNIEVSIENFIGGFPDTYGDENEPTINFFYRCRIIAGQLDPDDDVEAIAWDSVENANNLIVFSCCRLALEHFLTKN